MICWWVFTSMKVVQCCWMARGVEIPTARDANRQTSSLLGRSTPQQQTTGRICLGNCMSCCTEIEGADQAISPTHSTLGRPAQRWPCNARHLAWWSLEYQYFSHWNDTARKSERRSRRCHPPEGRLTTNPPRRFELSILCHRQRLAYCLHTVSKTPFCPNRYEERGTLSVFGHHLQSTSQLISRRKNSGENEMFFSSGSTTTQSVSGGDLLTELFLWVTPLADHITAQVAWGEQSNNERQGAVTLHTVFVCLKYHSLSCWRSLWRHQRCHLTMISIRTKCTL